MRDPAEMTIGVILALSEIDKSLDFVIDCTTARLILTVGAALLITLIG